MLHISHINYLNISQVKNEELESLCLVSTSQISCSVPIVPLCISNCVIVVLYMGPVSTLVNIPTLFKAKGK